MYVNISGTKCLAHFPHNPLFLYHQVQASLCHFLFHLKAMARPPLVRATNTDLKKECELHAVIRN